MHNQKTYHVYTIETAEDKKKRLGEVVNTQIQSFLYHMISLEREAKVMNAIVDFLFAYYNIEDNLKESCKQIINDFIHTTIPKEKDDSIVTTSNQSS